MLLIYELVMVTIIVLQIISLVLTLKVEKNALQKKVSEKQVQEARELQAILQKRKAQHEARKILSTDKRRDKNLNDKI